MEIRNPVPAELPDLIRMVSQALGYNKEEAGVARDFPQLYHPNNSKHLWLAAQKELLLAHAGFYPSVMQLEGGALPVAAIGGVCTQDEHQGKGLASQLVEKCVQEAAKEGAALVFLWSDKHDFYKKMGFHLIGRQWTFVFETRLAPALRERGLHCGMPAVALTISEGLVDEDFLHQSRALLLAMGLGPARSEEEHALYLKSGACRVISAWVGDRLAAYFVIGKGHDLQNYIHEWAGEEGALHHLAAQCLESFGHSFFLLSPQFMPEEVPWIYSLDEMGIGARAESLALVKLLDFEKIRRAVLDFTTRIGLDPSFLKLRREEHGYFVQWKAEPEHHLDEQGFLRLIFGPEMPAHSELRGFLPMRLWYWGMDSV
jgi:GNAT superfamily N-acetyltransferase